MPDLREQLAKLASIATADLEPLIDQAAAELGLVGEDQKERVEALLTRAWMDGAQAGQAVIPRESREEGPDVDEHALRPSDDA